MEVIREPDQTATAIRNYLWNNDELLKGDYKQYLNHPLAGHCYLASESYLCLVDDPEAWTPHQLVVEWDSGDIHHDLSHWYLVNHERDLIVDLTADQFDMTPTAPSYGGGIGRGFVPPSPSSRAEKVVSAIND